MTSVQRLTIIILLYNFLSVNSRLFVQDIRLPGGSSNPVNRTYATSAAQPWHVDECDIVGNSAARSRPIDNQCTGGLTDFAGFPL